MCLYLLPQILLPSQGQNTPGKKKNKKHLFPRNPATKSFLERVKKYCWWRIHVSSEMVASQKEWASSESSDATEKITHIHPYFASWHSSSPSCRGKLLLGGKPARERARGSTPPPFQGFTEEIHQLKRENIQISPQLLWWRKMSSLEPLKDE